MSMATPWEPPVAVRVPAKINVDLRVGPLRDDGFHELSTIFHAVSLFDVVTAETASADSVLVTGPYADLVPAGAQNLAAQAVAAAAHAWPAPTAPVALHVEKNIPVAAGLAGGSADAAGALVAVAKVWGTGWASDMLHHVAAGLGSDVNFALVGGNALGTGRGESVAPVLARGTHHWVLAVTRNGLSTPEVFRRLDELRGDRPVPAPAVSPQLMAALRSGSPSELGRHLHNDLHEAIDDLRPELRELRELGLASGALGAVVSGSGPTTVFLAGDADHAQHLADSLRQQRAAEEILVVTGPVPGATEVTPKPIPPSTPRLRMVPGISERGEA